MVEIDLALWLEAHPSPPEIDVIAWMIGIGLWMVGSFTTMLICYR